MPKSWFVTVVALACAAGAAADPVRLSKDQYLDKCEGAWAGQMIGVAYGGPTEWAPGCEGFIYTGRPNLDALQEWKPELIQKALNQDDLYVEMTFLRALEDHGLSITYEQAGTAFAHTVFDLWHANLFGRENVRLGIMTPESGHPSRNLHADDIDFQIEADALGIICPGMPLVSNRLGDIFGHIMCYGDGVYGGMFVAGMYAAAYFESSDVRAVIESGLACIPADSSYARCIRDAMRWHDEYPKDWLKTWRRIEDVWQTNEDCEPFWKSNIDAKLNGAYVVTGLLYGDGDLARTLEIATRCGQDSDCNPSTAAGILGCMKGFSGLDTQWTSGLDAVSSKPFSYTTYSFDTLIPACQRLTEALIERTGGKVSEDAYTIERQAPRAPDSLEQWDDQSQPWYKGERQ